MKYLHGIGKREALANKRTVSKRFLAVTAIFAVAITAASLNFGWNRAAATVPGTNVMADLSSSGGLTSGDSFQNAISRDGRFVAFTNDQNGFVSGDSNNNSDIFVRDLVNNTTTRSSVSTAGVSANNASVYPVISETGRYVVFASVASNLIDSRTISSSYLQMYMRDTVSGTTSILSEVSAGTFANNTTYPTSVSTDGRFVLFRSLATNLGPTMSGSSQNHVFLLDRSLGTITWITAPVGGGGIYSSDTVDAQMSCDGSLIVFDGVGPYYGLSGGSHRDVILMDRRGTTTLTNLTDFANGPAVSGKISCNGNYIGFTSWANNLDPATSGVNMLGYYHGYVYDRINGQFKLLDQSSAGSIANAGLVSNFNNALPLNLSDKGAAVFASSASNLVSGVSGSQVYIRDPNAGTTELLSQDSGGTQGDNSSSVPTISLDGKKAAYLSSATNLVSGDTNALRDIFVSDTGL